MSNDLIRPGITRLQAGKALHVPVTAGCALRVLEGQIRVVAPPAWINETVLRATSTVHARQVHVFERGGWVEIVAVSAARVQEELPVPARSAVGRWVWRFVGRLGRQMG
jgi:hypothetical protein